MARGHLQVTPEQYPAVRRENLTETLHGVAIEDPYRWLEDPDSPETVKFVEAQNALTSQVLEQCSTRPAFAKLLERLMDFEKFSAPFKRGGRYYYTHNTGKGLAQSVVYSQKTLEDAPTVLLDPNALSEDGTVALSSWSFSEDGTTLAYALSSGGSDWQRVLALRVDQETGAPSALPDELEHVKFSSLAWTHDGRGLFYNRYPPPPKGGDEAGTETTRADNQQLAYHVLGTPQEQDVTVLALTHDGRYLVLSIVCGCEPVNRVWILDLDAVPRSADGALDLCAYAFGQPGSKPLPLHKLVDDFTASYEYLGSSGSVWTFRTNAGAPRYRIQRVDVAAARPEWSDLVAEHPEHLLQWAAQVGPDKLVTAYLCNVQAQLKVRDLASGKALADIELPGIGSIAGFSGNHKSTEFFLSFTGFTEPGIILRGDLAESNSATTVHRRIATKGFDPDDFETTQLFATSRDGTRVPFFVVRAKGRALDGRAPTLLYGYGGFNISLTPAFSASRLAWMLAYGGISVVANLRGGGEFGTAWRDAGSRQHKQNVFDDFVACAEELVSKKYCSPDTLAIQGGSNGGLLVAACAEQRPDLFAAVLGQVGVMDLLRFHKFTIGHAWMTDYGNPDKAEDFGWLLPLSPVHNVARPADGGQYPAILLTTDRETSPQQNPLLTRVEVKAGHGAGKPTAKVIAEIADMYGFAAAIIGADWVADESAA
ncbi:hypothetical protein QBZ16_002571 [Prototheca wickerhamii]|uniref:Prolyl endopeptidase n=1 Tax=Prototheca wickerhamii TaxID=3111 RepID=A0AAD9IJI6_PROWI|nr:hypothetical protein QBZ16_002571 [Prototheca wickerhamii]